MIGVTLPAGAGDGPARAAAPSVAATIATTIAAYFIIGATILAHLGVVGHPDTFLDDLAFGAFVAIFGFVPMLQQRAQVAANTAAIEAAHLRLSALHAPPAGDVIAPS